MEGSKKLLQVIVLVFCWSAPSCQSQRCVLEAVLDKMQVSQNAARARKHFPFHMDFGNFVVSCLELRSCGGDPYHSLTCLWVVCLKGDVVLREVCKPGYQTPCQPYLHYMFQSRNLPAATNSWQGVIIRSHPKATFFDLARKCKTKTWGDLSMLG